MEDPVVLLERNLYGHPLAGLLWERQFEKVLLKYGWEKVSNRECLFVNRVLDHVYFGCTQRECQISKDFVDNYKNKFESRISARDMENQKQEPQGNLMPKLSLPGPMTWKVMQRNSWTGIANWQTKQRNNHIKLRRHVWMTTKLKEKEIG